MKKLWEQMRRLSRQINKEAEPEGRRSSGGVGRFQEGKFVEGEQRNKMTCSCPRRQTKRAQKPRQAAAGRSKTFEQVTGGKKRWTARPHDSNKDNLAQEEGSSLNTQEGAGNEAQVAAISTSHRRGN